MALAAGAAEAAETAAATMLAGIKRPTAADCSAVPVVARRQLPAVHSPPASRRSFAVSFPPSLYRPNRRSDIAPPPSAGLAAAAFAASWSLSQEKLAVVLIY